MKIVFLRHKRFFYSVFTVLALLYALLAADSCTSRVVQYDRNELKMPQRAYIGAQDTPRYQALRQKYGNKKKLPKGFELQALIALSHYPQLRNTRITFEVVPTMIPLASRPNPLSLLQPWREREYLVVISSKSSIKSVEPILLKNLSYNAQIGVLGHELAHTVFYLDKSSLDITRIAASYPLPSYRIKFESDTDRRAIKHGLGWQLHQWSKETLAAFGRDEEDQNDKQSTIERSYLSPSQIEEFMKKLPQYQNLRPNLPAE